MTELRKCPFCGGEASIYVAYDDGYYVCCDECGCGLPVYNTEQEAIEAWNKRVPPTDKDIDEYIEKIVQFYPELKDKILKICSGEVAE